MHPASHDSILTILTDQLRHPPAPSARAPSTRPTGTQIASTQSRKSPNQRPRVSPSPSFRLATAPLRRIHRQEGTPYARPLAELRRTTVPAAIAMTLPRDDSHAYPPTHPLYQPAAAASDLCARRTLSPTNTKTTTQAQTAIDATDHRRAPTDPRRAVAASCRARRAGAQRTAYRPGRRRLRHLRPRERRSPRHHHRQ
jgi:hypothetical protein